MSVSSTLRERRRTYGCRRQSYDNFSSLNTNSERSYLTSTGLDNDLTLFDRDIKKLLEKTERLVNRPSSNRKRGQVNGFNGSTYLGKSSIKNIRSHVHTDTRTIRTGVLNVYKEDYTTTESEWKKLLDENRLIEYACSLVKRRGHRYSKPLFRYSPDSPSPQSYDVPLGTQLVPNPEFPKDKEHLKYDEKDMNNNDNNNGSNPNNKVNTDNAETSHIDDKSFTTAGNHSSVSSSVCIPLFGQIPFILSENMQAPNCKTDDPIKIDTSNNGSNDREIEMDNILPSPKQSSTTPKYVESLHPSLIQVRITSDNTLREVEETRNEGNNSYQNLEERKHEVGDPYDISKLAKAIGHPSFPLQRKATNMITFGDHKPEKGTSLKTKANITSPEYGNERSLVSESLKVFRHKNIDDVKDTDTTRSSCVIDDNVGFIINLEEGNSDAEKPEEANSEEQTSRSNSVPGYNSHTNNVETLLITEDTKQETSSIGTGKPIIATDDRNEMLRTDNNTNELHAEGKPEIGCSFSVVYAKDSEDIIKGSPKPDVATQELDIVTIQSDKSENLDDDGFERIDEIPSIPPHSQSVPRILEGLINLGKSYFNIIWNIILAFTCRG